MTPDQVASLTDDQIDRLYRRPAIERAERMEREVRGEPAVSSLDSARPDRETFIAEMQSQFGGEREKWSAGYDRLKASWGD